MGGAECLDSVHVQLQEPLGDRVVIDKHNGEQVEVSGDSIYRDAQPGADWRVVEVPGRPAEAGFSMRLPPGWELNVMRVADGYVGEVLGDNMRLDHFPNLGGSRLSLVGQDLTMGQQRNAVAVFASIHVQPSPDTQD